jgi:hypothetical protein
VGAGAAISLFAGGGGGRATETASASNSVTGVSAVVDYPATGRETSLRVKVSGIRLGTTCDFWVVNGAGRRSWAGTWTIRPGYGPGHVFPASSNLPASSVHGFVITTASGKNLLTIPAN